MKNVNEETQKMLLNAVAAADRIRLDLMVIATLAGKIERTPELAEACGFNEGSTNDSNITSILSNPDVIHTLDAPNHWAVRSGITK